MKIIIIGSRTITNCQYVKNILDQCSIDYIVNDNCSKGVD